MALIGLSSLALVGSSVAWAQAGVEQAPTGWGSEWGVDEGLALRLDTEGYHLPTAIAFVPRPGSGPKDPLYFVTELRGEVKVVTNDRSVYTFARDLFQSRPEEELPESEGETGLGSICLAPEQGFVFVTFAYQEGSAAGVSSVPDGRPLAGVLRNNIVRFQATPQTFSLKPTGRAAFTELFAGDEASVSHQIGGCQVAGDLLYVSVGDGHQIAHSQQMNSLLGKVLRMTLDGGPAPRNPFDGAGGAAEFVWAYGFRNPFGLKSVGTRLFSADNGGDLDRFLEVRAGENYLWDGSDWSIGTRADVTLSPDVGPAQIEYYAGGSEHLPEEYRESFFLATSDPDRAGVLRLRYSLEESRAVGVPEYIVRYQGAASQLVTGVALGPDGLYFVPAMPDAGGRSAVFKVAYNPSHPHPILVTHMVDPVALIEEKGCFGCHRLQGEGGIIGPSLDRRPLVERLETRLNSEAYTRSVAELDRLNREPFRRSRNARAEVLRAPPREKVRTWMIHRLLEPKFDNPQARMPDLGLSKAEATLVTDYLLRKEPLLERWKESLLAMVPAAWRPRY
ncbi:MAG: PQQ-dependent sugar dehydrogenase, partial [Gemmatimonadales bacterium]|nr:PQQ-dependent sugar dehydrogenase [Gemmatimonadales bacterium]